MDYEIRPKNTKHAAILPVGQEVIFKIKKDHMDVKAADGGKTTTYVVVAMRPASQDNNTQSSSYQPPEKP